MPVALGRCRGGRRDALGVDPSGVRECPAGSRAHARFLARYFGRSRDDQITIELNCSLTIAEQLRDALTE